MENLSVNDLKKFITPAVLTGLAAIVIGLLFYFAQWHYSEDGHETLLGFYIVLCIFLALALQFRKKSLVIFIAVLIVLNFTYAYLKFDWRKDYIQNAENGQFPAINQYIDEFPSFEEHYFASLFDTPRWAAFSKECFEPALDNMPMAQECMSANLIADNYGIDISSVIDSHYEKMKRTAQMVQSGSIVNANFYRNCLNSRNCAFIPLLPAQVEASTLNMESETFVTIRRQFWSIVEDDTIQPIVCDFVDLCRVMRDANVIVLPESSN
jgi:hypothetical protein